MIIRLSSRLLFREISFGQALRAWSSTNMENVLNCMWSSNQTTMCEKNWHGEVVFDLKVWRLFREVCLGQALRIVSSTSMKREGNCIEVDVFFYVKQPCPKTT